ncbi:MAG TPA: glutamate--tRNA ligase [Negativicutes bacterium]|nr:glutamate--tRNA ligase [Negativicutes bacterium]
MTKKSKIILPKKIRLRFPPSPTGLLHIGNARTILFNYLFAKQNGGETVLRIEDTDKERSKLEYVQNIIDELTWLGITWDEGPDVSGAHGPYKQSQRTDIYKKYLEQLLADKKAYFCDCSAEELEAKKQDQQGRGLAPKYDGKCRDKNNAEGVIRFKIAGKKVGFTDIIRGDVEFDMALLGDMVIAKDLDTPLYHFAVVVDDYEMQISHIIRGEDHISNTPKQMLLQEALGFYTPMYAHLPLMLNADKSKMSKRAGDVAVSDYHKNGYLPEALINFMVLLGWNPGTEKEIFSLPELIKEFSLQKVQKSGAVFNVQRLDYLNGWYIRQKSVESLTKLCMPFLPENAKNLPPKQLEKIIAAHQGRMKKLSDITELADFFFVEKLEYDPALLAWGSMTSEEVKKSLQTSMEVLSGIGKWDAASIQEALDSAAGTLKGQTFWPLRIALSGKKASAPGPEIAEILGKERTLQHIQEAIEALENKN